MYRSDDRGQSWTKVSRSNRYMRSLSATYGWVFGQLRVDPRDENTIYVLGISLNVSHDGWKTFVHDLIIHPRDDIMVIATHGRGMFSLDVRPIQEFGKPAEEKQEEKKEKGKIEEKKADQESDELQEEAEEEREMGVE